MPSLRAAQKWFEDLRSHVAGRSTINGPFLFELKGTPAEYKAGLDYAIANGWLEPARGRHLCPLHRGGRRAVCLTKNHRRAGLGADSDDLARVYRFDLAQDSEMISPTLPI